MTLQYEEIYSQFYTMMVDPAFFKLPEEKAYDKMRNWLHMGFSTPYIRRLFSTLTLDDDVLNVTFELVNGIDEESDKEFIINILSQYMVIAWMQPQVDSAINLAVVLGTKEEKCLQSNYKATIARLDSLKVSLRKEIRDYGYVNNGYLSEDS